MNSVEQTEAIDIRSTEKMQKSKIEYRMLEEDCYFRCYHYDGFQTESEGDYEKYNVLQHPGKCVYANKAEIEKSGLKPQGKPWET